MRKLVNDLTGKRFGRLTVIGVEDNGKRHTYYACQCDCGNVKVIRADALIGGCTVSCGCKKKEQDRVNLTANHSHKMSGTRLYNIWVGLKGRCNNPNDARYDRYGGRGISVCEEWDKSFQSFYDWAISNGYSDELTIDRIDNDGNYEPSNCKWSTTAEQARNTRRNVYIKYNGEVYIITDLSKKLGIDIKFLSPLAKRGIELRGEV
jgi:hypothetical protein